MFSRIKPAGFAFGEILTSVQVNTLDIDHVNAVDGAAGGSYSPSSAIAIAGSGLQIDALLQANGSSHFAGEVTLQAASQLIVVSTASAEFFTDLNAYNNLAVLGDTTLTGFLAASSSAYFAGEVTFQAGSQVIVGSTAAMEVFSPFNAHDTASFAGVTTFTANIVAAGANFNNAVDIAGALTGTTGTFTGALVAFMFAGQVRKENRIQTVVTDANQTITMSAYDIVRVGNVTTASRDWTISTTSVTAGESIRLCNNSNFDIVIKHGVTTIFTLTAGGTKPIWADALWDGVSLTITAYKV